MLDVKYPDNIRKFRSNPEKSLSSMYSFPNSNNFGVISHSKGFGADFLLWVRSPSWAVKKSRGRFHQSSAKGSTKVSLRFHQFRGVSGCLGQIRLGLPKGSAEGSTKFHQSSVKVPPSSPTVPPWFSKFRGVSGSLPRRVPPSFHQGSTKFLQVSWSLIPCQIRLDGGSTKFKVSPKFHQGFTKVSRRLRKFRGSAGGSPITSLHSHFLQFFFAFFPNSVSFGAFSHSKGLRAK